MSDQGSLIGATLSADEIEQLAHRLQQIDNPDALSLEAVDGLFCALIASPRGVPPSEYLPVLLGGEAGNSRAFADLSDAQATMTLLMRFWNSIIADFQADSIHMPYVEEPGPDGVCGRAWARGFMRGTRLAPLGWTELFAREDEGQVIMIPLVAGAIDSDWPKQPLVREQSDEVLQTMIAGAARAYRHFEAARLLNAQAGDRSGEAGDGGDRDPSHPPTFVRASPKIGRNEPCSCGSGKKFKKCCGATSEVLH